MHNHALGKKASLPGALRILAEDGWRMLLQVHDFAEDNRPANYRHLADAIGVSDPHQLGQVLYPQAANIHYATLTERDAVILEGAGVPPERLHTLPNPIAEFGEMPAQDEARSRVFPLLDLSAGSRLIVYPVRGIRRKNLGEMLLLAALAPEGTYFALTLAPKNPVEAVSFNRWRQLAEELELPCLFNSGGPKEEDGYGCDFKETLAAADAILTTSVAEGFGMVFLEAWLAGKPLIGRDLPEITREFKAAGLSFNGLWEELLLPSNTFDASAEDFGRLAPTEQIEVVIKTAGSQLIQEKFREANPRLAERLTTCASNCLEEINRNADVVREAYSTHRLGEHIRTTYGSLLSSIAGTCSGLRRGEKIFSHFNKPENLWPVRTEECLKN